MGDKLLEQAIILSLKAHFFRPIHYKSPIENAFYLGRAMADLTDRHAALFANNQHPFQLDIYNEYNKFLRTLHSEGHNTRSTELKDRMAELSEEKRSALNSKEGE